MSLENAYSAVPKKTISTLSCAGRMPIMQRDEIFVNLENDIASQMLNALPKEIVQTKAPSMNTPVKFVSFEDAMKELVELELKS